MLPCSNLVTAAVAVGQIETGPPTESITAIGPVVKTRFAIPRPAESPRNTTRESPNDREQDHLTVAAPPQKLKLFLTFYFKMVGDVYHMPRSQRRIAITGT